MVRFSMNALYEMWDDEYGEKITVGPDGDGLGLVEIRSYSHTGEIVSRITCHPHQAGLVADGIKQYLKTLESEDE